MGRGFVDRLRPLGCIDGAYLAQVQLACLQGGGVVGFFRSVIHRDLDFGGIDQSRPECLQRRPAVGCVQSKAFLEHVVQRVRDVGQGAKRRTVQPGFGRHGQVAAQSAEQAGRDRVDLSSRGAGTPGVPKLPGQQLRVGGIGGVPLFQGVGLTAGEHFPGVFAQYDLLRADIHIGGFRVCLSRNGLDGQQRQAHSVLPGQGTAVCRNVLRKCELFHAGSSKG